MENELVFDLDTVAEYLVEKCGCTVEDADMYLIGEDEYLASIGISGYGHEDGMPFLTAEEGASIVVEAQAVEDYVVEHKGLARALVEKLYQAELEYMEEIGFISAADLS